MDSGPSGVAARYLATLFDSGTASGLGDRVLLERFADRQGADDPMAEAAFAALVERHGPMVLRVCRAVLGDRHEAEDAFQATFLVLASRARSIRQSDSIGSWLHGVALRVSGRARWRSARRHAPRRAQTGRSEVGQPFQADSVRSVPVCSGPAVRPVRPRQAGKPDLRVRRSDPSPLRVPEDQKSNPPSRKAEPTVLIPHRDRDWQAADPPIHY
ncbi:MAG: RNA polymerase sigma factor [Isosphaeraceae bacterium]